MASRAPFEDVITSAVASAVRRAVEDVGRAAAPELDARGNAVPDLEPPPDGIVDAYEVVGVAPGATWEEIVAAYRTRARAWHPDTHGSPHADGELLRRLNVAYEELGVRRGRRSGASVLQPNVVARKRGKDGDSEESTDLDAPEHAWWTSTPIDPYRRDEIRPEPAAPPPEIGDDDGEAPETAGEVITDDPYDVLRIAPSASWEEIVASYRKLARWYHPDGLVDPGPDDLASCEAMIRRLNAAYAELRVRRGR